MANLEPKPRVLALDVGRKRIGLAITDPLGLTAQGIDTLQRTKLKEDLAHVARLAAEREVGLILIGDPLHLSGNASRMGEYARGFGERLRQLTRLPVRYWDERLTSVEAERMLRERGQRIVRQEGAVDRLAAVILLESFMESEAWQAQTFGEQ